MLRSPQPPGRRALAFVMLCLAGNPGLAQPPPSTDSPPKTVRIQRTARAPVIDGVLDEEIWQRAPLVTDLHQVSPVEGAEPSERTEVYLLYDRDNLYIGARLFDSEPKLINARVLRQNQPIGSDDRFFVHIDPFNTHRSGYLFGVNPNGVRFDGIYEGVTRRQFDWDGIWQAAATITEDGWTLEIAIPFKTLSFDPAADTWRMNFARNIERRNESIAWVSRNRNTDLSTMGDVKGISQIEQGRGLDVVPSLSVRDRRAIGGNAAESATEPSIDVFYKITPQLNASLTVNTDFSATEVDDRQVNLTRFSLFFPERRDFFLQDVDIFQFGRLQQDGRPFFSRKIGIDPTSGTPVPIGAGAKVSGRIGRFDLGTLAVQQDAYGAVDATTAFVGRVAANVLDESSIGMIMTKGDPGSNLDNSVIGIDFRYQNSTFAGGRSLEGDAWIQRSDTEGLTGNDHAMGVALRVPSNTGLRGEFALNRIEANFNPALGFVRRKGVDDLTLKLGHTWRPRGGAIRSIYSGLDANTVDYLDNGELQTQALDFQLMNLEFASQDRVIVGVSRNEEGLRAPFAIASNVTIPAGHYSFGTVNAGVRTGDQRAIAGGLFVNSGTFYDGNRLGINTMFGWRPSRHFRTSINYQYNDVSLPYGDFVVRVLRWSIETVFSSKLSWINLIQYDNISETVGINSRLHWIPQAGREAFLVLNHNVDDLDHDNVFRSSFSELTLKYSYTFRF